MFQFESLKLDTGDSISVAKVMCHECGREFEVPKWIVEVEVERNGDNAEFSCADMGLPHLRTKVLT